MLSGLVRLFCPSDPLPTLPNEGVPEALAVRRDQAGGGAGKMDRQNKRAGLSHLPQKTPTRQRGLPGVSVPNGRPGRLPALQRVMHHIAGYDRLLAPRTDIDAAMAR